MHIARSLFIALAFTFAALAAPVAHATTYSSTTTYFTRFHFDAEAFGKPVAAVSAHTGVLTVKAAWRDADAYWVDVHDIALVRAGDHFEAKATLVGSSSYANHYAQGVVVQYWVTFEDGTELITDAVTVEDRHPRSVTNGDSGPIEDFQAEFGEALETDAVDATWTSSLTQVWLG
jgi:hypothetical protein